jgi:hypothetical protein
VVKTVSEGPQLSTPGLISPYQRKLPLVAAARPPTDRTHCPSERLSFIGFWPWEPQRCLNVKDRLLFLHTSGR